MQIKTKVMGKTRAIQTTGFIRKPRIQAAGLMTVIMTLGVCGYAANLRAEDHAIEVSGVVEVELGFSSFDAGKEPSTGGDVPQGDDKPDSKTSDITLATVEINLDTKVADNVIAHILLLHEEDDTPLEIDEGTITVGNQEDGFYVSAGQMYVPFGSFDSNLVSDPITLELGETRESAVLLGFAKGAFNGAFYVFNGDISESSKGTTNGDDNIEHMGFSLAYAADSMAFGFDYISSIGDSDTLQGLLVQPPLGIKSYVAGMAVHGSMTFGRFNLIAEYVAALDDFKTTLDGSSTTTDDFVTPTQKKRKPAAFNVEVGVEVGDGTLALGFQGTSGAEEILPESRILLGYSTAIADNTTLSAEYLMEEQYAYSVTQNTTGAKTGTLTVQLAVAF